MTVDTQHTFAEDAEFGDTEWFDGSDSSTIDNEFDVAYVELRHAVLQAKEDGASFTDIHDALIVVNDDADSLPDHTDDPESVSGILDAAEEIEEEYGYAAMREAAFPLATHAGNLLDVGYWFDGEVSWDDLDPCYAELRGVVLDEYAGSRWKSFGRILASVIVVEYDAPMSNELVNEEVIRVGDSLYAEYPAEQVSEAANRLREPLKSNLPEPTEEDREKLWSMFGVEIDDDQSFGEAIEDDLDDFLSRYE